MEELKEPKGCNFFASVFVIVSMFIYAYGLYKIGQKFFYWLWN